MKNYTRKLAKGTSIVFIMIVAGAVVSFLLRMLLSRELTQSEFGLFFSVMSVVGLLTLFRDLGLGQALVKYLSEFKVYGETVKAKSTVVLVVLSQLISSGIIAVILIIFSDFLATNFFGSAEASLLIQMIAIFYWLFSLTDVIQLSFQGLQKMNYFSSVVFVRMSLTLVITYVLLRWGFSVLSPAYAYMASAIIVPIIYFPLLLKVFPGFLKVKTELTRDLARTIYKFGIPVMIVAISSVVLAHTDVMTLTYFKGIDEVAFYVTAQPTAQLIWYFTIALSAVLLPMTSELWTLNRKDLLAVGMEQTLKYSLIILMPFLLILISFPQVVLNLLFGAKYVTAAPVLQILAVGETAFAIALINMYFLSGVGKPSISAKITILAGLLNFIGNVALIPEYGMIGAATATTVSSLLILALTSYKVRQIIHFNFPLAQWSKTTFAGLVFLATIFYIKAAVMINPWIELFICLAVGGFIFLVLILVFHVVTKEELVDLRNRIFSI
ncbi:MAG: flippase [Candidatus Thorarchaeota archaeon]